MTKEILETHTILPYGDHSRHYVPRKYVLAGAPSWLDKYDTGFMLAHDAIEHQNGAASIGTSLDELEAFGAIYLIRANREGGQASAFGRICSDTLTADDCWGLPGTEYILRNLTQIFRDMKEDEFWLSPTARGYSTKCLSDFTDLRDLLRPRVTHIVDSITPGYEREKRRERMERYLDWVAPALQRGYWLAMERFYGLDAEDVFFSVVEALDAAFKVNDRKRPQDITLTVYKDGTVGTEFEPLPEENLFDIAMMRAATAPLIHDAVLFDYEAAFKTETTGD